MPSYDDRQRHASETFNGAFKNAKQWQSAANAIHAKPDDPSNGARPRAERAAEAMFSAALTHVALEAHKRGREAEPIAADAKERFDSVSTLLDAHVGAGESTADRRRMVLDRVQALPSPLPENRDIAKILNKPNQRTTQPLELRDGKTVDRMIDESPSHVRRPFTAQTARALADAVIEMKDVLSLKVKAFDMLYRDGRDRMDVDQDHARPLIAAPDRARSLGAEPRPAGLQDENALRRGIKRERSGAPDIAADGAGDGSRSVHRLGRVGAKRMRPMDFEIHEDDGAAMRPAPVQAFESNDKENHYGEREPGDATGSQRPAPERQPLGDSTQRILNTRSRDGSFGL